MASLTIPMMTEFQFCCNFIFSLIFRNGELRGHGLLSRLGLERLELWNSAGKILISWFLGHSVKCLSFTVLTPKISLKFLAADLPSQTLSSTAGISGEASDQIFFVSHNHHCHLQRCHNWILFPSNAQNIVVYRKRTNLHGWVGALIFAKSKRKHFSSWGLGTFLNLLKLTLICT